MDKTTRNFMTQIQLGVRIHSLNHLYDMVNKRVNISGLLASHIPHVYSGSTIFMAFIADYDEIHQEQLKFKSTMDFVPVTLHTPVDVPVTKHKNQVIQYQ